MTPPTEGSRFDALHAELASRLATLPDKPVETARSTFVTLWHLAAGNSFAVESALERPLPPLDAEGERRLTALIDRRISGVPLAHLTGVQRFMGLDLFASDDALIPRVETEALVRGALEVLGAILEGRPLTVIDVCTGSGNVALAIANQDHRTRVFASDLSGRAVALAQRNARHLGLDDRVEVRCGDLLQPFDEPRFVGHVDLLTANPPYISSAKVDTMPAEISKFEPRLAFDGGALGISILFRLLRDAPRYLAPGGWLAFEVGLGQAESTMKRLERSNAFSNVHGVPDAAGVIRAVLAQAAHAS